MPARFASVTSDLELMLVAGDQMVGVPTVLAYDSSDPFAVTASFDTGGDAPIVWVFARDLLLEGLQRPAGQGDVTVWPSIEDDGDTIHVALSSPDGEAEFQASASQIERFLARTFALVPIGEELHNIDVDAAYTALLGPLDPLA